MERLSKGVTTVIKLWKPINIRIPEDGDSTIIEIVLHVTKPQKASIIE
jgi:hypothetical protein